MSETATEQSAADILAELGAERDDDFFNVAPPDPGPRLEIDDEAEDGAPQKGAPLASEDEEVEDVEGTPEEFDKMRTDAGWTKNEITGQWQDSNGKFQKADALPPVTKEGEAAPKVVTPPRQLATEFKVRGKDGKEVPADSIADMELEFTANGKTVKKSGDAVVRLAQMGFYNEEREQAVQAALDNVSQSEERYTALQSSYDELRDFATRVLAGDDDYLLSQRDEFAQATSPEARVARLQRELDAERARTSGEATAKDSQAFAESRLIPKLQALRTQYPTVTADEINGRFMALLSPLTNKSTGRIPSERFPAMERIAANELRAWAEATHESRVEAQTASVAAAKKKEDIATGKVIKMRRAVHRALSPTQDRGTRAGQQPRSQTAPKSWKEFQQQEGLV